MDGRRDPHRIRTHNDDARTRMTWPSGHPPRSALHLSQAAGDLGCFMSFTAGRGYLGMDMQNISQMNGAAVVTSV